MTPFDTLEKTELTYLVSRMEIAFFPRGQRIGNKGDPSFQHLYIIQHGAVKISFVNDSGEELLMDVRGEGDYFGARNLLQGKPAMVDISAQQDLITLILPGDELKQLVTRHPAFKRFFGFSLAQTIQAVRQSDNFQWPQPIGLSAINLDVFVTGKRVADLMVKNVLTCTPDVSVQTAARLMAQRRVSSIVVTGERPHPMGIVTDNDLRTKVVAAGFGGQSPVTQIMSQPVHSIAPEAYVFDAMVSMSQHGVSLLVVIEEERIVGIISEHDLQMESSGFGGPPVPYSWIGLGSEGRMEQTLHTDQDNALFFSNVSATDEVECKTWFSKFSELVVDSLVRSGIPPCPGNIMASNPQWCQSEAWWQDTFLNWITDPNPHTLEDKLLRAIRQNRLFIRFMARNALNNQPPLGLLKQFMLEKSGEHKKKLDLKMRGLTPVVDAARLLSLDLGIKTQNTLDRLAEINQRGFLDKNFYDDLREAYEFIVYMQISRHLDAIAKGEAPAYGCPGCEIAGSGRVCRAKSFILWRVRT